jgi:hypothetical protein
VLAPVALDEDVRGIGIGHSPALACRDPFVGIG